MHKLDNRREFILALGEAKRMGFLAMDRRMKPLGMSQATWRTLYWLDREGGGVTQRALAEKMGIEGPTLVRLLDNLERGGLLERRPSPTDRRANTLHLTAKARPLLKTINRIADEVRAELCEGIKEDALATARTVLEQVADNATRDKLAISQSA
jgi:MarR family transcriptional regulator for hemolysin